MPTKTYLRLVPPAVAGMGERIRQTREARKLSQDAFGLGKSQVSRIESGDIDPSVGQVAIIATQLGVSLDWLVLGQKAASAPRAARIIVATDPSQVAGLLSALEREGADYVLNEAPGRKNNGE